jgi:DNA-binding transcriptional MerR regulator/methylmalonyl-CoA mutase cobalamin-binding subunit
MTTAASGRSSPRSAMAEARYRIGTAARLSGLSTHAIRVWERRYGALSPDRSEGGARLYSDDEVARLRLLKRAVDRGHPIGQIVALGAAELERLAGNQAVSAPAASQPPVTGEPLLDELLGAVQRFDALRAEQLLERARARHSARTLLRDVLSPLLQRVGEAWADGRICVASEHVATALVRDYAGALLRQFPRDPDAETLVITTPAGELHEIGALLAAATAAMLGFGVLYLGPNLPAPEIALAVEGSGSKLVALSTVALPVELAAVEITALGGLLPRDVGIVLGGDRAREIAQKLDFRVRVLDDLDHLERFLSARRRPA